MGSGGFGGGVVVRGTSLAFDCCDGTQRGCPGPLGVTGGELIRGSAGRQGASGNENDGGA